MHANSASSVTETSALESTCPVDSSHMFANQFNTVSSINPSLKDLTISTLCLMPALYLFQLSTLDSSSLIRPPSPTANSNNSFGNIGLTPVSNAAEATHNPMPSKSASTVTEANVLESACPEGTCHVSTNSFNAVSRKFPFLNSPHAFEHRAYRLLIFCFSSLRLKRTRYVHSLPWFTPIILSVTRALPLFPTSRKR